MDPGASVERLSTNMHEDSWKRTPGCRDIIRRDSPRCCLRHGMHWSNLGIRRLVEKCRDRNHTQDSPQALPHCPWPLTPSSPEADRASSKVSTQEGMKQGSDTGRRKNVIMCIKRYFSSLLPINISMSPVFTLFLVGTNPVSKVVLAWKQFSISQQRMVD